MPDVSDERWVLEGLLNFKPNRHTLGGTAYLLVASPSGQFEGNWLVDCPLWSDETLAVIDRHGGVENIFLTHRGAIGEVHHFQRRYGCRVVMHEQEAYLIKARLPTTQVHSFREDTPLGSGLSVIWTPGHSPGSSCLLWDGHGGVLFSGRHLLSDAEGRPTAVRTAKTFHWARQQASVERLRSYTYRYICPGAALGLLKGKRYITVG